MTDTASDKNGAGNNHVRSRGSNVCDDLIEFVGSQTARS
jgi:hypothetical protein